MALNLSQPDSINVLIGDQNWAWPEAVSQIFRPRGINALIAEKPDDIVQIIDNSKVHLAIINDKDGIKTLKLIRQHNNLLPCMVLAEHINNKLLSEALNLNVFSVLTKPVNLMQLAEQLNRLFSKYYACDLFADMAEPKTANKMLIVKKTRSIFIRWNNKDKTR